MKKTNDENAGGENAAAENKEAGAAPAADLAAKTTDAGAPEEALIDGFAGFLRSSKHVHQIDLLGNLRKQAVCLFTEHRGFVRVHRNHSVARALHVSGDTIGRPPRL